MGGNGRLSTRREWHKRRRRRRKLHVCILRWENREYDRKWRKVEIGDDGSSGSSEVVVGG